MTTVVNKNKESYDVYIGRGSIFGNPYVIGKDGDRNQVIDRYKDWFKFMLQDEVFLGAVCELKDKKLGCFCAPQRCHGEIIAEWVNQL